MSKEIKSVLLDRRQGLVRRFLDGLDDARILRAIRELLERVRDVFTGNLDWDVIEFAEIDTLADALEDVLIVFVVDARSIKLFWLLAFGHFNC